MVVNTILSNGVGDQFASNVENLKNSFCDFENAFSEKVSAILYDDCGSGWHPILEETHLELYKIDPDYILISVSKRWGELEYVFRSTRESLYPAMNNIVSAAQKQCQETCESCGGIDDVYKREYRGEWTVYCKYCWNDYSFRRYEDEQINKSLTISYIHDTDGTRTQCLHIPQVRKFIFDVNYLQSVSPEFLYSLISGFGYKTVSESLIEAIYANCPDVDSQEDVTVVFSYI
jgi:hypothetical protein